MIVPSDCRDPGDILYFLFGQADSQAGHLPSHDNCGITSLLKTNSETNEKPGLGLVSFLENQLFSGKVSD